MATRTVIERKLPTHKERLLARESSLRLAGLGRKDLAVLLPDGRKVVLPASAVRLLATALSQMADGAAVTVLPAHAELTTQQAADLLNVSRPYVIKEMEAGRLPFHKVGAHRRISLGDLMEYKRESDAAAEAALAELVAMGQELNLGY